MFQLKKLLFPVLLLVVLLPGSAHAQVDEIIEITVEEVGYGGLYRPDQWLPIKVEIVNRGPDFNGRLVVRPATSGGGIDDVFSAPVRDLSRPIAPASETTETRTLYMIATGGDTRIRIELLNEGDSVVTSQDVSLRDLRARDALYVAVPADSAARLSDVNVAGYDAFQVGWEIDDIPDRPEGLLAVDAMIFSDVDTTRLTDSQREALTGWVLEGGHLIVTGGDTGGETAAGLDDLLPFSPQSVTTVADLTPLARLGGDYETQLTGETFISEGDVRDGARVLTEDADGRPLVVRHEIGNGTVDYMTVSPNLAPLQRYDLSDTWFTLLTSTQAVPGWGRQQINWGEAQTAIEILPGIDLLPAVLSLIAFLGAYILLVGPINYLILARFNRRGYAWVTIPLLIGVFSALAWSVGFELRGNEVTLSRLSVVQAWPNSDRARVDQLVGLLAPRRGDYSLVPEETDRMLRPLGRGDEFIPLGDRQTAIEIQQFNGFEAVDFPVDASFIAGFAASAGIERPEITGSATVRSTLDGGFSVRGLVRNDSDVTLTSPLILVRGTGLTFNTPLNPGDILDFELGPVPADIQEPPVPHRLEADRGQMEVTALGSRVRVSSVDNADAIMRTQIPQDPTLTTDDLDDETRRREAFVQAMIRDTYASSARGNRVYLIGWADRAPLSEDVPGESIRLVETTLYIIELEVEQTSTPGMETVVTQDQFTWVSLERDGLPNVGPVGIEVFDESRAAFRFTPLPGSVLETVDTLTLVLDRGSSTRLGGVIELWNWDEADWERVTFESGVRIEVEDPERFIGPQNAVQVRTVPRSESGLLLISRLGVEQRGT